MAVRDAAGTGAAVETQVPTLPGRLHASKGPAQGVLQHTWSAQVRPAVHSAVSMHPPPWGTGVLVGVAVGVDVGVRVGVAVGVRVGVSVGVLVAVWVAVGVWVGVAVGVWVGVALGVAVGVLVAGQPPVQVDSSPRYSPPADSQVVWLTGPAH